MHGIVNSMIDYDDYIDFGGNSASENEVDSDWEYGCEVEQIFKNPIMSCVVSCMVAAGTSFGTAHASATTAPPSESDNDEPVSAQNYQQDMIQLPTHQLTNLVIS